MDEQQYERFRDQQIREWDRRALEGLPPPHLDRPPCKSLWRCLVDYFRGRSKEREPI